MSFHLIELVSWSLLHLSVFQFLVVMSICTNSALLVCLYDQEGLWNLSPGLAAILIMEHILLFIKFGFSRIVPEVLLLHWILNPIRVQKYLNASTIYWLTYGSNRNLLGLKLLGCKMRLKQNRSVQGNCWGAILETSKNSKKWKRRNRSDSGIARKCLLFGLNRLDDHFLWAA